MILDTDLTAEGAVQAVMDQLARVQLWVGFRLEGVTYVRADGQELSPRPSQKLRNHSPDGFNWGYGGSGPAQLALAILLHVGLPRELAEHLYQTYKWEHVARWPGDRNWYVLGQQLRDWIQDKLDEVAQRQRVQQEGGSDGA